MSCRFTLSRAVLIFATLAALLIAFESRAVEFSVQGRSGETLISSTITLSAPQSVAAITLKALQDAKARGEVMNYSADEDGLYSIDNLGNDMEILNPTDMRAWGWCFEINGLVPEVMPGETQVAADQDRIIWFYAHAHYQDGNWVAQCVSDRTTRRK